MATTSQRSFAGGEISPALYGRTDTVKYATGLRICKNTLILRYGGASNRPGTSFVGEVKDSTKKSRLIPFIFNAAQTYILEFSDLSMRVIQDGSFLHDTTKTITGITRANPAVVTITSHGYSNGDEVYISGVVGMTEVNGRSFKVANVTTHTFSLKDMGGTDINSSSFTAYSSGGSSAHIYSITTPYTEDQLPFINYVQSADVITIVHPEHTPKELLRTGSTNWTLQNISFVPTAAQPTNISSSPGTVGSSVHHRYKITAVNIDSLEESLPGVGASSWTITGATKANPCVVTSASHGLSNNDEIYISSVAGMTELNGQVYYVNNVATNTFELYGVNSTNFGTYTSGGSFKKVFTACDSGAEPSSSAPNVITWTRATGAVEYNIYKETNGVYGLLGIATGGSFNDIGSTINTSITPPYARNPFLGTGNYPSVVTYVQQRLCFANTDNEPEKIWLSRTANFHNFTTSSPSQSDDSIAFTLAGRQVNSVKAMVDLGKLIAFTSGGEWGILGDSAGVIRPTDINARQYTYNGSGDLPPVVVDGSAIYQQSRGSILRDLEFRYEVDGFTGNDLTLFAAHLFDSYTLVDWTFQQIPHSILWVARSDGTLLGLTLVKSQEVMAWHRHDLGGEVESVCSVPEGSEDFLYVVVKRTINGRSVRYVERLNSRLISNIKDSIFVDSALTYDGRNYTATTMTLSGGVNWTYDEELTLTSSSSYFSVSEVGNEIHLTSGSDTIRCKIISYTSSTVVKVNANRTVPIGIRNTSLTDWARAVDRISGLYHLEGEDVSIFADSFVVSNPNNDSYITIPVTDGTVNLDRCYSVIHIGLPYISDIETLDIDNPNGETLADKKKLVGEVTIFVENSRGIFVGPKSPVDSLKDGLTELKLRETENYDSPPSLVTDNLSVIIRPEWNSNGRVFIRQLDPIPMTILSVNPAGKLYFR